MPPHGRRQPGHAEPILIGANIDPVSPIRRRIGTIRGTRGASSDTAGRPPRRRRVPFCRGNGKNGRKVHESLGQETKTLVHRRKIHILKAYANQTK